LIGKRSREERDTPYPENIRSKARGPQAHIVVRRVQSGGKVPVGGIDPNVTESLSGVIEDLPIVRGHRSQCFTDALKRWKTHLIDRCPGLGELDRARR
jgi:hypothetical protein